MLRSWIKKFASSFLSTLPIFFVVLVVFLLEKHTVPPFDFISTTEAISDSEFIGFSVSAIFIALGLGLFTIGADQSMTKIGELVGGSLMKKRKLFLVIAMTFILGIVVTIAEPDLAVLSSQLGDVSPIAVIAFIGVGVGLFLIVGVLRIIFGKSLNIFFVVFYGLIFTLSYFINPKFLPICFDAGGVTTGPVTVPFILAFGVGLAASKTSGHHGDDSFGLTALCSVGPILAVMLLSKFIDPAVLDQPYSMEIIPSDFWSNFGFTVLNTMKDVAFAILPIAVIFVIYDLIFLRLPAVKLINIFVGMVNIFIGLVALLAAVNAGFKPIASKIGRSMGGNDGMFPVAILIAGLFGFFGVLAEPAVRVLAKEVEAVSDAAIKEWQVLLVLAVSIGLAVIMAIIRSYFGFDLMFYLIPGYILALGLSFVVPNIYTAMAFDSGGVASGPMTSTFVLPFCVGFAYTQLESKGVELTTGNIYQYGFGIVALVAMMPLIVLQLVGLYTKIKKAIVYREARKRIVEEDDDQVIHFIEEGA